MNKDLRIFIILLSLFSLYSLESFCQNFDYKENSVYIYNFIKYTSWSSQKSNIRIGIVGYTPVENELKTLIAKKSNTGIGYTIKNIKASESPTVDVVIVAESSSDELSNINTLTAKLPILIITEKENMNRFGACISFFIDEDNDFKTEYQLSLRNCKSRGLTINEQILNNAVLIR